VIDRIKSLLGTHVGFIYDGRAETPNQSAMLTIEADQIVLEVPLLGAAEPYDAWFQVNARLPEDLLFRNVSTAIHLSGLEFGGYQRGIGSQHARGFLRCRRLVEAGARAIGYRQIHGLHTELVGLPAWIKPAVFTEDVETNEESRVTAVTHRAERRDRLEVTGMPCLSLAPHFETAHDYPNGEHSIRETMAIQTKYSDLQSWEVHSREHRALQDLVSLAFWHPCNLSVEKALHLEDQLATLDGEGHGFEWRAAFVPVFGRRARGLPIRPIPQSRFSLFTYEDIGKEGLAKWYEEFDDLKKSMGVLSASLFRQGPTVEVMMLQVAVALA
jgi:hypothetical protein